MTQHKFDFTYYTVQVILAHYLSIGKAKFLAAHNLKLL